MIWSLQSLMDKHW